MVCNAQDGQVGTGGSVRTRLIRNIIGLQDQQQQQQQQQQFGHYPSDNITSHDFASNIASNSAGNGVPEARPFRRAWEELLASASALPVRQPPRRGQDETETTTSSRWRPGGIGYLVPQNVETRLGQHGRSMVRQLVDGNVVLMQRTRPSISSSLVQQVDQTTNTSSVLGRRRRENEVEGEIRGPQQGRPCNNRMEYGGRFNGNEDDIPTHYFSTSETQEQEYLARSLHQSQQVQQQQVQHRSGLIRFPLQQSPTTRVNIPASPQTTRQTTVNNQQHLQLELSSSASSSPQRLAPLSSSFNERDARLMTLRRLNQQHHRNTQPSSETHSTPSSNTLNANPNNISSSIERTPFYRLLRDQIAPEHAAQVQAHLEEGNERMEIDQDEISIEELRRHRISTLRDLRRNTDLRHLVRLVSTSTQDESFSSDGNGPFY